MNWLDSMIIIVLVFGAINGLRKGFITSITKLFGFIISIFIAKTYYLLMTTFIIENTDIEDKIMEFVFKEGTMSNFLDIPLSTLKILSNGGELTNNINSFIAVSILNAISLLAIFVGCRIIFAFIEIFLNSLFKLPGLNDVNRMGGLFIGLTISGLGLLIFFAIIIPLGNIGSWEFMSNSIQTSTLSKYFYSYNFILNWILDSALNFINAGIK